MKYWKATSQGLPSRNSKRSEDPGWTIIATIWLALGMVSTRVVQIIHMDAEVENFTSLGYPICLLTLVGIAKILGVVVLLMPKAPLLKEWAYAGFFFTMSGAIISHIASNDAVNEIFGPLLLLILTLVSWYFRPADRKIIALVNH